MSIRRRVQQPVISVELRAKRARRAAESRRRIEARGRYDICTGCGHIVCRCMNRPAS